MENDKKYNFHVLLAGTNTFKETRLRDLSFCEKDCLDVKEALIANEINVPPENIISLLGTDLTSDGFRKAAVKILKNDRSEEDVVIIYYSGHGFRLPDSRETYLATHDVTYDVLNKDPFEGFSLNTLQRLIQDSKAYYIMVILDACYSGRIITDTERSQSFADDENFENLSQYFNTHSSRLMLASSRAESIEDTKLENGLFTSWLLRGLRGQAAAPRTDELTDSDLVKFLRQNLPHYQRAVISSLAQMQGLLEIGQFNKDKHRDLINSEDQTQPPMVDSPWNGYGKRISHLVESFAKGGYASIIHKYLSATTQFLASHTSTYINLQYPKESQGYPINDDVEVATTYVQQYNEHSSDEFGYYESDREKYYVLALDAQRTKFIVVKGSKHLKVALEDYYTLKSFFSAIQQNIEDENLIIAMILDVLKKEFNHLPSELRSKRKTLFEEHLEQTTIYFQPIVHLDKHSTHTDGFEALARNQHTLATPKELFTAAELWEKDFLIDLDIALLKKAISLYKEMISRSQEFRRSYARPELSINVYPTSLLQPEYFTTLTHLAFENNLLYGKNLILEISEKQRIPSETFTEELAKYIQTIGLRFAIDDYGTGHANYASLLRIRPTYIKIDRSILEDGLRNGLNPIKSCVDNIYSLVCARNLAPTKVVFEGYDDEIADRISLRDLYSVGVRYVQGNWLCKPQKSIVRLPKSIYDKTTRALSDPDSITL